MDHIDIPGNTSSSDHYIVNAFRKRLNLSPLEYSQESGMKYLRGVLIKTIKEAGGRIDDSADVDLLVRTLEKLVATEISDSNQEEN